MARKRHKRGGAAKSLHQRTIENLHNQMQRKAIQDWMREQRGRYHCLVFGSPAKPKLQAKENFLTNHMLKRYEVPAGEIFAA